MKVINVKKQQPKSEYPNIYRSVHTKSLVLFTSDRTGILLSGPNIGTCYIGSYKRIARDWELVSCTVTIKS